MSLNCLVCQRLQRTDSDREWGNNKPHNRNVCCINVERSWSGNLSPLPYKPVARDRDGDSLPGGSTNVKLIKKSHRRLRSTGNLALGEAREPRLVRSSGMRRDWSFEDLHKRGGDRKDFREQ